jgi:amidohydrolase
MLTNSDIAELTAFRRALHRAPEVSRQEQQTARTIAAALTADQVVTGLGGHGVAAVYNGAEPGPTVMFRAELDALPIEELSEAPHRSTIPGKGHLCGHDGHMTILMGLSRLLSRKRPALGRVILMFQPAEEDGSGAAAVIADPAFTALRPDWAFSLHNMPGFALGHAHLRPGPVNCASQGLKITLHGKTAHASQPEAGISPAKAMARLIPALTDLGQGGALVPGYRLVTVTHARLGEPAFGIAPGAAEVWATLRTLEDDAMAALFAEATALAHQAAQDHGLTVRFETHDDFAACTNHPEAVGHITVALDAMGMTHESGAILRASEDFGRFGAAPTKSAMLFLGAGIGPALHNPDYDFPDDLIPVGAHLFQRIARDILG